MLYVVYFCEWLDRWLMGDVVPGPMAVSGRRYEATCMTPHLAVEWAEQCGTQFVEQTLLANRLREAAAVWKPLSWQSVVVLRKVIGPANTDEEVVQSLQEVPVWLSR